MRWTPLLLACLAVGVALGDEGVDPTTAEVLAALQGRDQEARKAYLQGLSERQLARVLDDFVEDGVGSYHRRAVSRVLGWKILDRRAACLRGLAPQAEALIGAPRLDVLVYPRTDGSTSTAPLERLVACRILGSPYVWGGPPEARRLNSPFVGPANGGLIGLTSKRKDRPPIGARSARSAIVADPTAPGNERLAPIINYLLVKHTGTHDAWVNLIERRVDLVFVARAPSPDETQLAAEQGVALDARPIARDALVFLTNRINPVDSLTLDEIRGIYTGGVERWRAVGGSDDPIEAYQRNRNSGSQELFLERVMGDVEPTAAPRELIRDSMIGPYNAVAERVHAIGYTVWYYERYMACLPEVKPLAIAGVEPSPANIADGSYPLVTTVYAAVREDEPADSITRRLRDWLLTEAGQAVLAESGYIPVD